MNEYDEYDEDEIDRLQNIESKYNAINERINRKIGHDGLHDDLDDHNNRVASMEHQIAHPYQHMIGATGLGAVVGGIGTLMMAPKAHPAIASAAALGIGGLGGLASRISRDRAIRDIDEARRKRDAFKAEWDKLGV